MGAVEGLCAARAAWLLVTREHKWRLLYGGYVF